MTTRYVPEQYPDLVTALMACVSGDTVIISTSTAMTMLGYTSTLDDITIEAAEGFSPLLDHTLASVGGLEVVGDGWTFTAIRFRSTIPGSGGSALRLTGTDHRITDCRFEGSPAAIAGNWTGIAERCQYRHITSFVANSTLVAFFHASEFIACEANRLINCPDGTVDHGTFVRCRTDLTMVAADIVTNNTAQLCEVTDTGFIFDGPGDCSGNNAFECTSDGNFNGATADNTTDDPMHVNLATNLRLEPESLLIRSTDGGGSGFDYNGNQYPSPSTRGAHESIVIASVTVDDWQTITVDIGALSKYSAGFLDRASWTLTTVGGIRAAVIAVEEESDTLIMSLWPGLSPGIAYTLTASFAGYGIGEFAFTPDAALQTSDIVDDYRYVAAIHNAIGRAIHGFIGINEAVLIEDFPIDDPSVFVDQTLGWPEAGGFFLDGLRFTYTSKTDGALHGVATDTLRVPPEPGAGLANEGAIPRGSVLVFDEAGYRPKA